MTDKDRESGLDPVEYLAYKERLLHINSRMVVDDGRLAYTLGRRRVLVSYSKAELKRLISRRETPD